MRRRNPNEFWFHISKMKALVEKIEKNHPYDGDILAEMFGKIHEMRARIVYFSDVESFREFYYHEIEDFFEKNEIISVENEKLMREYFDNECLDMEKQVIKNAEIRMTASALNRVTSVLWK